MSRAPTITAAVIALNERANLPGLLHSLAWVDEVVLIDGGSRDGTAELARSLGCKVVEHPFDNYAAQRNRALRHASGDWILSIDADERCAPALAEEIRGRLLYGSYAAFRLPIRSRIFGRRMRFSGTQDDRPIRLFQRGSGRWDGDVHEVLRIAGRVGELDGWLEHETLPDLASFLAKMERYTTLEARHRVAEGVSPQWRDRWISPLIETGRRLIWKAGLFDGPQGWAFCALSGLSQWVLADKHRRLWAQQLAASAVDVSPSPAMTWPPQFDPPHEVMRPTHPPHLPVAADDSFSRVLEESR